MSDELKNSGVKSSVGWLELANYDGNPTDTDALRTGLAFVSGSLMKWNGTSWSTVGGSSTSGSLDDSYDDGRVVTVDNGAVTLNGVNQDTAVLALAGDGDSAGALITFAHTTATRNDLLGTGSSWAITGQGAATLTAIVMGDDESITLGASSDAVIQWVSSSNFLDIAGATNFDGDMIIEAAHTLTITGAAGADKFTVTAGDVVLGEGSITLTDDDNAASLKVTNDGATTIGAAAAGGVVQIACAPLTTGALLSLELTEGTLNGGWYLRAWDVTAGAAVFTVGENGLTTIAGGTAGTDILSVTAGDLFLSDTDGSLFESEDGTATLLTLDNKAGVIASDSAVLLIDAGGAVASGGNLLRIAPTGTPNAGAIGIEYVGAAKTNQAMYIDADPTGVDVVHLHGGGALTNGFAVLGITNDGNLATGGALLNLTLGGTPNSAARVFEIDGGSKDAIAMYIDSDAATESAVQITGAGAIATGKAMLEVVNTGTPAANASYVGHFTFTGTATNNPVVLAVDNGTANAAPLLVTSNVASATRAAATFIQDSTTGAQSVITLQQDDVSEEFIAFNSTAGSGASVDLTNTTPAAVAGSVIVSAVDGTLYRIALYAAAGWS